MDIILYLLSCLYVDRKTFNTLVEVWSLAQGGGVGEAGENTAGGLDR